MLYFAYGANTNIDNMMGRCPNAKKLTGLVLPDYRLVFRGVADVEHAPYNEVQGVLWWITNKCEDALDIYEGFPTLYRKETFAISINDTVEDVMFYTMNRMGYNLPSEHYFKCIEEGYIQNKLPTAGLYESLDSVM